HRLDGAYGVAHHLRLVLAREIARDLVVVAMAFDLVAGILNGLDRVGKALRDGTAGDEGGLHPLFLQDAQQATDRVVRAVLSLAPALIVEDAVLVRLHVLAALKIEGEHHGGPLAMRPADEVIVMIFLEHRMPRDLPTRPDPGSVAELSPYHATVAPPA